MGQDSSSEARVLSHEELVKVLAGRFADKCFTSLEIFSLKDVFKTLADQEAGVYYLKEDTMARFLEVPDALGASPVLFQIASFIGAFPFLQDAPTILGLEQMVIVVTLLTGRYQRVLAGGAKSRAKLLFKSMAVYDRKSIEVRADGGQAVDGVDGADDTDQSEDDELVLEALDYLGTAAIRPTEASPTTRKIMVPADSLRKLIMLLLLVAPLGPQEDLSMYADRTSGSQLDSLRSTADWILAAFLDGDESSGISYDRFDAVISTSAPFMFDGFAPLFEHFLFSKNLNLNRHRGETPAVQPPVEVVQPLLQESGSIMNLDVLSQLSFFIPGTSLFRRLRLLYSGEVDGFSMGSFESKVFNWRAPTLLLVRGNRLPVSDSHRSTGPESSFLSTLPPRRFRPGGSDDNDTLTFGLYLGQPWKHTHRECFGGDDTLLFQLEPVHDVFRASTMNRDYVSYNKPSTSTGHAGINVGCPPPQPTKTYRRASTIALGPVSLVLDGSFEFGCFTHDFTSKGGSFLNSAARQVDFQEHFEIVSLEVWGCGGDEEAKHQAERWAWEAREAEARRKINLGTGDIEADRALLEMAGLIGQNRSGGSMM
ncbi:restriction of telomere capping protein 5 [Podospora conica]|nr:restriction of telomere capping protein 5 [Schizothecium conicum]